MKDDREFQRINVSIPCLILCDDRLISGEVTNISLSGAFISRASDILPEGSAIILTLQRKQNIKLKATVDAKIIHSFQEVREEEQTSSFGVRFEEPLKTVSNMLNLVLHK